MDIQLFTTVDASGARMSAFEALIRSIAANAAAIEGVDVKLFALLQNCSAAQAASVAATMPAFVELMPIDRRVSLSAARNMLLRPRLQAQAFTELTIVAFPDDDAWYPPGLLAALVQRFGDRPDLDFWFCRYGSAPVQIGAGAGSPASRRNVIRNSSSNTMFMRGGVAAAVGLFDEGLGLGSALGSAEDVDYALRVFQRSRQAVFQDDVLVGHRDKIPGLRGKYYQGSLFVLFRHARQVGFVELCRKVLIGCYLAVKGELRFAAYLHALRTAFAEFNATGAARRASPPTG